MYTDNPKSYEWNSNLTLDQGDKYQLTNKMIQGETKKIKFTVKHIYTRDSNNNVFKLQSGETYIRVSLELEDPENGDKESINENIWANIMSYFIMSLGFIPDQRIGKNNIPNVDTFVETKNNVGHAIIERSFYIHKESGEEIPCLRVRQWITKEGELKPLSSLFNQKAEDDEAAEDIPF